MCILSADNRHFMKKILFLFLLAALAGCAAKTESFDAVAKFQEGEDAMRKESYEKARKAYQEIQEKAPDRSYDPVLMLRIADTYFGDEKYEEALVEYQNFLNYHPVNKDAAYAQFQIGMCAFNQFTTIDRDPEPLHASVKEFEGLLTKFPRSPYEAQAKRHIAVSKDRISEYELYVARFYHKKESEKAAVSRCEYVLKNYPDSSAEKDTLFLIGKSYAELGENDLARTSLETLAAKYPAMTGAAESLLRKLPAK